MKNKYPINKEFFPYMYLKTPVNPALIRAAQKFMKPPVFFRSGKELIIESAMIPTYQGGEIQVYMITPRSVEGKLPCVIDYHGGGFIFEAFYSQYRMAMLYARYGGFKVLFVNYRLAPDYPFPYPQEDAYAAYQWVCDNAEMLNVDPSRIGLLGDSAGGTLAVTTCMLARERKAEYRPVFELLIYPWLDDRKISDSYRKFTDTPMGNSSLSKVVGPIINPNPDKIPLFLHSPVEADCFNDLPPAYIEVAEFDCLHDDGIAYADLLQRAGIQTVLIETKGTMHGFDTKVSAPTSIRMIKNRIRYMRRIFGKQII